MSASTTSPSPLRLRVALLETEPVRVHGFIAIFQNHPRIEFVVTDLARLLADHECTLALVGMHGDQLSPAVLGTLRGLRPELRLIVMGPEADDEAILSAIGAGAKAYLDAGASALQVERAIEIVNQGSIWAPRRVLSLFVDRVTRPAPRAPVSPTIHFTAREKEVLKLLVAARSNREIAVTLGIEERTVKAHVAKLMRKVGVGNRIALSIFAITHSIVSQAEDLPGKA
jgi:DNA-binding NarL/FixJ family response regulator